MLRHSLLALLLAVTGAQAQAALGSGDLAFTAFNADEDGWAMAALADIAPNTKVYFTDNEWQGSAFNSGESYFQWSSGSTAIAAGTVIRFSAVDTTGLKASAGLLNRASVAGSTNYGLSQSADTLYAYLGTAAAAPTTFLAAISTGGFSATEGGLSNTGLSVGHGAIALRNGSDYAEYTGPRNGLASFTAYRALVADASQWTDKGDGSYASLVPNTAPFTVSAVPEPKDYAMFLAGLCLMGGIARRRPLR